MIRIRRIRGRVPIGRVYEIQYQPVSGTLEDGLYGATRTPIAYLEPLLGPAQARSLVEEVDWQRELDNTGWAVEFDEAAGTFESNAPRFESRLLRGRASPLGRGVGWWWLVSHATLVAFLIYAFIETARAHDPEDGANIGAGLILLPLLAQGLPWSVVYVISIPILYDSPPEVWLPLSLGPAVLNVALHSAYRIARWKRIRTARREQHCSLAESHS